MEVDGMLRIFNRSEKLHNLSNYIGDGDTKTFNALSENKPYGDDHLIQKIECVGHVQKRMALMMNRCTGFDKPNTWCKYNAAINNNLQNYKHKPSVAKAVRDVIKPVFADLSHPALLKKCLEIAEIAANLATSVFNDGNQILISILEKFGLKINRNVCVSLAERDNRRIFTSRQKCLQSSFEARRAKKIKKE
ncbi:uncharacterized protein TNCV_4761341 [Trichonephila clavipes]|uniref:Mutator-like transposase domain-containing protein n=1 Tax=Trichonephila clavipes TaxID=2585209 RepID=A0A8X6RMS4_TRICX|nr:uncharacterized protein TNCV_4761341 [Trichonephila clavipes]